MAKKRHYASGYYEGMAGRRKQEMEDAGMIHEDHSAVANLPQEVVMRPYPKAPGYQDYGLDDTIGGIDYQMGKDAHAKTIKRGPYPEKY